MIFNIWAPNQEHPSFETPISSFMGSESENGTSGSRGMMIAL